VVLRGLPVQQLSLELDGLSELKLAGQTTRESALSPRLIIDRIAATKRSFFGRSSPKAAI
jgi:hypothetical protein